jgi:hypothetical protein
MRRTKVFWGSSYDRGLPALLYLWPDVLEKFPDAELHICYGWDLFVTVYNNNFERMGWKQSVDELMNQDGITHHGRVGKKELSTIRKECGIWAYPTDFQEINCITALECQRDGLVPVTMDLAALSETVGSGFKIEGDINNPEVIEEYRRVLLNVMGDAKLWNEESKKARKFALKYDWDKISPVWTTEFVTPTSKPKVSIITPTNRNGFWNIMAYNLSVQSYPIHEWIVIDDSPTRQSKNPSRMREDYGLNIVYTKTPKEYKGKYSLVRADNIGWQRATGDLLVWIQDFVVIPERGIEALVDIYRHNKDCLIAPTDKHYSIKGKYDFTKPDAFMGNLDVFGDLVFDNSRNQYKGMRRTENPYDFELNYGAIPRKIVEELNGFWEFGDNYGLGYDNTDIAWRALQKGHKIIIDDTNVCSCIRHQDYLDDERDNANKEVFEKIVAKTQSGELPLVREEKYEHNNTW